MPIDCANPKNKAESSLCACQKAVDLMEENLRVYEKRLEDYSTNLASYNRWKSALSDWENKTGVYADWQNKISSMNTVFPVMTRWEKVCGTNLVNTPEANWQCGNTADQNKLYDPWGFYCYEQFAGNTVCNLNLRCARTQQSKDKIINDYNAIKPTSDPLDSNKKWTEDQKPQTPQQNVVNNILCCTQLFQDIQSDSDIDFSNISQQCSQKINDRLQNDSPQVQAPTKVAKKNKTKIQTTTIAPSKISNITIIVVVIVILCSSSISSIMLFLYL